VRYLAGRRSQNGHGRFVFEATQTRENEKSLVSREKASYKFQVREGFDDLRVQDSRAPQAEHSPSPFIEALPQ
jgi:hypothetical protein